MERQNIDLSQLKFRVLDEADEMLRMGFVEDVELILGLLFFSRNTGADAQYQFLNKTFLFNGRDFAFSSHFLPFFS